MVAGNPFSDMGGRYLADKLVQGNMTLKILDIHNSEMTESVERQLVDQLKDSSSLQLLGSLQGRKDHRVIRIDGDDNVVCGN